MNFKGKVVAQYPVQTGTYMGEQWTNQSFVVAAEETRGDTQMRDRIVIKVKGKNLEDFLAAGVNKGGVWNFNLEMDAEERYRKDNGEAYPVNKSVICIGFSN